MKSKYDFSNAKRGAVIQDKNKTRITIYIDNIILDTFRDQADQEGRGYQTLINEALRKHLSDTTNQITKNDVRQIVREELQLVNESDITYTGSSSNLREPFQYYNDNEKNADKSHFLQCYFEELENAQLRATELYATHKFHLEGITILMCRIAAISRARYPQLKDYAAFKKLVEHYSGFYDVFENIDLLFFYQWPHSKYANDKVYSKLGNYKEIVSIFQNKFGAEDLIQDSLKRYQKREDLLSLLLSAKLSNFDQDNFVNYIELFSNNQIFYEYARCEAVHNNDFPLINIGLTFPDMQRTYTHNHQVTGEIIKDSLKGIVANLKKECLDKNKWPHEL